MATEEPEHSDDGEDAGEASRTSRDRIEESADRAVEQFDRSVIDLLSWLLDTETRAKIYIYLHQHPQSTSEEVAQGTGLYPSTVREALAELHEEGVVDRDKRESGGAGNNPYEYTAIKPSELVGNIVGDVQRELNAVFNLDSYMGSGEGETSDSEPVRITVNEEPVDDDGDDEDAESTDDAE